jgi:hypothetical protein
VTKTRVIFNRTEYHVEHEKNELVRINLDDNDITGNFDDKHKAKFLRLALQVEKWSAESQRKGKGNG